MGVVDKLSTSVATRAYHLFRSGGEITHKIFPVMRDRAQLKGFEIAPLSMLLVGEMYREGVEASRGNRPTLGRLFTNMVEGGLSYLITSTVSILYSIIGTLKGAYDAGKAQTTSEKVYAGIKNTLMFLTGFVGLNIGVQYTHLMRQTHAKELLKSFLGQDAYNKLFTAEKKFAFGKVPNITEFFNKDLSTVTGLSDEMKTGLGSLKAAMKDLADKAKCLCLPEKFAQHLKITKDNPATLRKMRLLVGDFESAQTGLINHYTKLVAQHGEPKLQEALKLAVGNGDKLKDFHQVLRTTNQYHNYELFRLFNPVFGYILTLGLIGVPLVKLASFMLSKPGEAPIDQHFSARDTSLYLESFPRFQTHAGNIFAGHGAGHGESFPTGNGPAMQQWAANHRI